MSSDSDEFEFDDDCDKSVDNCNVWLLVTIQDVVPNIPKSVQTVHTSYLQMHHFINIYLYNHVDSKPK